MNNHVHRRMGVSISLALAQLWCASLATAQVDSRAEVAAALYAASATQAAAERFADEKMRKQRTAIERLQAQLGAAAANEKEIRAQLTASQETYVTELAARDRAYSREIAVFRKAVEDISATAEGAAALARFNAGDEPGALAILDDLRRARDAGRKKRADIESAAEGRRIAALALEARTKGKQTTAQVITRYEDVTRLDPDEFWDWVELARLYRDAGTLRAAMSAAKHAAETAADNRDRGVAFNELGNVLVGQGDRAGALAAYRKGLAIREALAARDAANTDGQRDLSISHEKIGDVLVAQGDGAGALAAYRKDLAISEALAARDPANTEWQRDLPAGHDRIGNVLVAQGDGAGALAAYRKGLAIRETLAARDPANTDWQRDLSVSHNKIGDVLVAQGDGPGRWRPIARASRIREALAARDPANTGWQRDLSVSHNKIGDVLVAQGDGPGRWPPIARASRSARRWPRAIRPTPTGSATSR